MNILWITLESILPANSGGRLGVFKRLEKISKTENIYLFYPFDYKSELKYEKDLYKYCKEVHAYSRAENKKNAILSLFKYPYTVASRNIKEMKIDIMKCIKENKIDVINVDFPHMYVNLINMDINIPVILNEHNIEWKVYRNIAKSHKNVIKKIIYYIDSYRLKRYEEKIIKKLKPDMVTFVSTKDLEFFKKSNEKTKVKTELIPVGADLKKNIDLKTNKTNKKNIIFVGKMSYGPNIEAVKWFVSNVFEKILNTYKDTKLYIVGKDPTDEILRLKNENIVVTGKVDSLDEYYNLADLVVIPLLNGGGVKVKLLEAISYNKKIVSTSVGVEGTIYSNGETIPISDSPIKFSEFCIKSLEDNEEIVKRNSNAYKLFVENYTWDNIGNKYTSTIEEVVKNGNKR